jgi:hypothetical protein
MPQASSDIAAMSVPTNLWYAVAQQYLKVILDKETTPTARSILYSALSKLDGHPLQIWAQEQFSAYQAIITKVFEAYQAEVDATRHRESTEKRVEVLSAELKALEGEMELVRDNPDQRQTGLPYAKVRKATWHCLAKR